MANNQIADAAIRLQLLGLAVFPLKERSKEPATAHGFKDATKDCAKAAAWWGDGTALGVAVATGQASGVAVVDIDPRNGGNEWTPPEPLPPTWECLTGGGGRHLYYRITGGLKSRKLAPGVDLKADGGYVVAPPSIHPSGKAYCWELSGEPVDTARADAPAWLVVSIDPVSACTGLSEPDSSRLSRATLQFLQFGAQDGERNNRLFAAACDMAGCGFGLADAETRLLAAAGAAGLEEREARRTVGSAYSAPRGPARPEESAITIPRHLQIESPIDGPKETDKAPLPTGVKPSTPQNRSLISNVVDTVRKDAEGKTVPVQHYKPLDQVSAELLEASAAWPKSAGGALFVDRGGLIGDRARVRTLGRPDELYAWMQERHAVRWSRSQCQDAASKAPRTPPTKTEFFSHLRDMACERYAAASAYPHVPPMHSVYYLPCDLPPPTGERLREFIEALNPETDHDRALMLAALLTPAWGGEPGTRPAFVFCSTHGRGSGKTSTATALSEVWGGAPLLDYRDNWPDVCKRIMSSDDRDSRVFIFDNIKGTFGGAGLEAALTAKQISGWRSYVGQVSRPNDATYYVTFNMPELSPDLAARAVIINIGAPRHEAAFVEWASGFVRLHRAQLVSDLVALLGGPKAAVPPSGRDRWQAWMRDVLGCLPNAADLAGLIKSRRPAVDAEADDRDDWTGMLGDLCREKNGKQDGELSAHDIYQRAIERRLWQPDKSTAESRDRQNCLRRAERMLAGTGVLERALDPNGGKKLVGVRDNQGARVGRSQVFSVAAKSDDVTLTESDIPI